MTTIDRRRNALSPLSQRVVGRHSRVHGGPRLELVETALAIAVAACVFVVHDVPYVLRAPYWLDEAGVAASTRISLGQLRLATASSPIGWTFLLRLAPTSGQQDQRLVPLLFAALTVLAGELSERTITDQGVAERTLRANRIRVYGSSDPRELLNQGPGYALSLHATNG